MSHTSATARKMNAKHQSTAPKSDIWDGINREEMISVAAYFRAENRGFVGGNSLADWLVAEAEINAMLNSSKNVH